MGQQRGGVDGPARFGLRHRRAWLAFTGIAACGAVLSAGAAVPALAHSGAVHHRRRKHALGGTHTSPRPSEKPIQVKWASLSQHGRQLEWKVQFRYPISLTKLKRQQRTLCLLIAWPHHDQLRGELCAKPAKGKHFRRLVYRRIKAGRAHDGHTIHGRITKPNARELQAWFLPSQIGLHYTRLRWQVINGVPGPGCTRLPGAPAGCISLYPRPAKLLRLHTPKLVGCVASGSSLVFGGSSRRHDIALTFDDGPWSEPPSIDFVRLLHRYHVPATFFEIGNQISSYDPTGSVERQMLADGDIIGDHTWTHPDMTTLSAAQQSSELELTRRAIQSKTGFRTCIWRPPYGAENSQVVSLARSLGLITIQWDVDTVDWSTPGTATIYQRAVSGAHNGAIILQHFGGGPRYETLDALPEEITTLRRRGYRFVTIPQMLGLRLIYK
jgi:peptidoglycan-N-acetylglucosamine deacetylase